jgi:hypothetical protein
VRRSAAHIPERLYRRLEKLDDQTVPIAETYRHLATQAEEWGLARPCYERVRTLVHQSRRWKRSRGPSTSTVLLDVAFRVRPPEALVDHLSGDVLPRRYRR